jgi:hypothetical protein
MAEKKLYASLEDWNEINYEELTSDSTMLVNTTGDDQGLIAAIRAGEFKGDKGDKGDPGNVTLPDGLVISAKGYTFLAQESSQEQRELLNVPDNAEDPNSFFLTKGDIGITSEDVVGGDDRRLVPLGGIIMWAGLVNEIPIGWYLCNGANGTPDLRDRFIVGSGSTYSTGSSGGSKDAVVVSHTHTGSTNITGAHTHSYTMAPAYHAEEGGNSRANTPVTAQTGSAGNHSHILIIDTVGQSGVNANLPPYYALAFIQFKGYN